MFIISVICGAKFVLNFLLFTVLNANELLLFSDVGKYEEKNESVMRFEVMMCSLVTL